MNAYSQMLASYDHAAFVETALRVAIEDNPNAVRNSPSWVEADIKGAAVGDWRFRKYLEVVQRQLTEKWGSVSIIENELTAQAASDYRLKKLPSKIRRTIIEAAAVRLYAELDGWTGIERREGRKWTDHFEPFKMSLTGSVARLMLSGITGSTTKAAALRVMLRKSASLRLASRQSAC